MASYKKSADTCKHILDAAENLFYEKGYTATTTREIADKSGISRGNLTYHFPNKSDIATEICCMFYESFFDEIKENFGDIDDIILRDSIHTAIQMRLLMTKNKYMDFYQELDRYHIQSSLSVDMNFRHFVEQAEYLELGYTQGELIACATVFPSALTSLVHAVKRRENRLTEDEAVEMMHRVHLNLLRLDNASIEAYIAKAREYTDRTTWVIPALTSIKLEYKKD